jgi:hypothetical protein
MVETMLKFIRESIATREDMVLNGGIDDMETYRQITGEIKGLKDSIHIITEVLEKYTEE